jgi:hypothetical protein
MIFISSVPYMLINRMDQYRRGVICLSGVRVGGNILSYHPEEE